MQKKTRKALFYGIFIVLVVGIIVLFNSDFTSKTIKTIIKPNSRDVASQQDMTRKLDLVKNDESQADENARRLQEEIDNVSENFQGYTIYIEAGTYYIGSSIDVKDKVNIKGDGKSNTIFTSKNGTVFTSSSINDTNFEGFTVSNTTGSGFDIDSVRNSSWTDVTVENATESGFLIDNPVNVVMEGCEAINCGQNGFVIGTSYSDDEYIYLDGCNASGNGENATGDSLGPGNTSNPVNPDHAIKNYGYGFCIESHSDNGVTSTNGYVLNRCISAENVQNFGGSTESNDVTLQNCQIRGSVGSTFGFTGRRLYYINCGVDSNFEDVRSWETGTDEEQEYFKAIYWGLNNGITVGTDWQNFSPDKDIPRCQGITFIYRFMYSPYRRTGTETPYRVDDAFNMKFTDVGTDKYYSNAVEWAVNNNITAGTGTGSTFGPNELCKKKDYIRWLYRLAGSPAASGNMPFTDVTQDDDGYYDAILWAVNSNIVTASGTDSKFNGDNQFTRKEAMLYLYRYAQSSNTSFFIRYNFQGGTVTNEESRNLNDSITLNQPTKAGYIFKGWTGSTKSGVNDGTVNASDVSSSNPIADFTITSEQKGNIVYTAVWEKGDPVRYTIEEYLQNEDGSYPTDPTNTREMQADPSETSITIEPRPIDGYVTPQSQTTTLDPDHPENNIIRFDYARDNHNPNTNNQNSPGGNNQNRNNQNRPNNNGNSNSNPNGNGANNQAPWMNNQNNQNRPNNNNQNQNRNNQNRPNNNGQTPNRNNQNRPNNNGQNPNGNNQNRPNNNGNSNSNPNGNGANNQAPWMNNQNNQNRPNNNGQTPNRNNQNRPNNNGQNPNGNNQNRPNNNGQNQNGNNQNRPNNNGQTPNRNNQNRPNNNGQNENRNNQNRPNNNGQNENRNNQNRPNNNGQNPSRNTPNRPGNNGNGQSNPDDSNNNNGGQTNPRNSGSRNNGNGGGSSRNSGGGSSSRSGGVNGATRSGNSSQSGNTAPGKLPYTGLRIAIIPVIIGLSFLAVVFFIKYRRYDK